MYILTLARFARQSERVLRKPSDIPSILKRENNQHASEVVGFCFHNPSLFLSRNAQMAKTADELQYYTNKNISRHNFTPSRCYL